MLIYRDSGKQKAGPALIQKMAVMTAITVSLLINQFQKAFILILTELIIAAVLEKLHNHMAHNWFFADNAFPQRAFLTPASSPAAAMCFSRTDWIKTKDIFFNHGYYGCRLDSSRHPAHPYLGQSHLLKGYYKPLCCGLFYKFCHGHQYSVRLSKKVCPLARSCRR